LPVLPIFLYAAVAFFVAAVALRARKYARGRAHLRWELYPVAHERGRAQYGGSHFEVPDHWTRQRALDRRGEARAMAAEIVLLAGVRRHNRSLWRFSLPYHLGVYLVSLWLGLVVAGGLFWPAGDLPRPLSLAVDATGFGGFGLGLVGGAGLLWRRLRDVSLRPYNAPADLANLGAWLTAMGWSLGVHAAEGGFASLVAFGGDWLRLRAVAPAWPIAVEVVLGALLLAYLPLSRMFHFVAKYFLYHDVRWDDAPNPPGGDLERRLVRAMDFGLAWSAPHAAGAGTWREAARSHTDGESS